MTKRHSSWRIVPGFTLIELMIVVAIIGILASIAIPKFADMVRKSKEAATKGNLGSLRSALSIYYSDMEGQYPLTYSTLTVSGKYLSAIPNAMAADYHATTTLEECVGFAGFPVQYYLTYTCNTFISDQGGWAYDNTGPVGLSPIGVILVECTHTDSKGTFWTNY